VAVDYRVFDHWTVTGELLYTRDVNAVSYHNANLTAANASFAGADARPRWVGGNRIHANVANAIVLGNDAKGSSWNVAASIERAYRNGLFVKGAYSYGISRNTVNPGSIARLAEALLMSTLYSPSPNASEGSQTTHS